VQNAVSTAAWRRILFGIGFAIAAIVAWEFAKLIPRTISIFLIAAFIAFGVRPICARLEARRVPKPLAIAIVFAVLLLLIVLGIAIFVPLTIAQVQLLVTHMPAYVTAAQNWATSSEAWLQEKIPGLNIPPNSFNLGQLGSQRASQLATETLTSLGTILLGTATAFFIAFSAIVLSIFFLLNDRQIADGFTSMFPRSRREVARKLAAEVTETFGSYISGQVIISAITGAVVAIGSAIIGFKFSLLLGILTAVAYAIPVIGMLIAQVVAVILCAPQGVWMIVLVQIIMFGMARVSDNVLVPKIMGQSVGVSPIGVMFAVFAGGELFGIPGLLLGIPAAALIKILWRYFVAPWLSVRLDR
jgi:predicted PurR-regulated permease PerM